MRCSFHLGLRGAGPVFLSFLLLGSPAAALSPPPPQPDDELLPLLYETMGGDQWHNNEGWLDPDVHWCDWYGVVCGEELFPGIAPGYFEFLELELSQNNLSGEMTEELAALLFANASPSDRLDLSGNSVTGPLHFYPRLTEFVDLSGNSLSGELPPLEWPTSLRPNGIGDEALVAEQRLFLARNAFSGSIPNDWSEATLESLDLSDNQLTAGHQAAIDAIKDDSGNGHVYLTGNPLEGELTDAVLSAPLSERDEFGAYGGIDICFTGLTVENPDVRDWLAEHHVASGDFDQCLGRERTEVDATLSGSWYNPDRPGEGVSLMMLESGAPLLYSFSFDLDGNQQWTFEVGKAGDRWIAWDDLQETRGTFSEGIRREDDYTFIRPTAKYRFDRVGRDTVNLYRRYTDFRSCGPWGTPADGPFYPCPIFFHSDRMDYQRLTELAGTTCDNQDWAQQFSGAWYDPERTGEGFVVEVLPHRRVVLYWFTYRPGDSERQAWMIGNGELETPIIGTPPPGTPVAYIDFDTLHQPTGATYGADFDPADVTLEDWGSLRLEFFRDGSGRVYYESDKPDYSSGQYPIERLARPMLADCSGEVYE